MKNKLFILSAFSLIFFIGCSKEEHQEQEGDSGITLSSNTIRLLAGLEYSVDVLRGDGDLGLVSMNSDIASGWWSDNGKKIIIKTHDVGTTSVIVKDRNDYRRSVEINVTAEYLNGNFEVVGKKAEILVLVNDASIQEIIESELKAMAQALSGSTFLFNSKTGTVDIDYTLAGRKGGKHQGTYDWYVDSLIVKVDDATDKHNFGAIDNNSFMIEVRNLAEVYREKHPQLVISTVRLAHYLSRI